MVKKQGWYAVESDEPIVELETDKVNLEVPSPVDGVLSEINANNGQVVEVGAILGSVTQKWSASSNKKKKRLFKTVNLQKIEKSEEPLMKSGPELFEEQQLLN